jgi:heterodisulfide reductase subunit A
MNKDALVIGGGIAGIQAALDIAGMGTNVHLVEKKPSIGGRMIQLDKTFPTMDCSACVMTPKMVEVARNDNVTIHTCSEVTSAARVAGGFRVDILKHARYVDEKKCTGCGLCVSKCPVEVENEFDQGVGVRKAIYVPFPQAVPLTTTIDIDNCIFCGLCAKVCETDAIDFGQRDVSQVINVGAIVVTSGFELFDPREKPTYGYGAHMDIITALTMERMLSASGPTGGRVVRLSNGRIPKKIAYVQCVGSRDKSVGRTYCSRVCCMYAIKQARMLKDRIPDAEVTIYFMDIRASGKGYEEFYAKATEDFGVKFVKGRVGKIFPAAGGEEVLIRYEDVGKGMLFQKRHDLVVLSAGLGPSDGGLAKTLGLRRDEDMFVAVKDYKLDAVSTSAEGVFVAGVAEGPKDIPDTVTHASAAAMKAAIYLSRREA